MFGLFVPHTVSAVECTQDILINCSIPKFTIRVSVNPLIVRPADPAKINFVVTPGPEIFYPRSYVRIDITSKNNASDTDLLTQASFSCSSGELKAGTCGVTFTSNTESGTFNYTYSAFVGSESTDFGNGQDMTGGNFSVIVSQGADPVCISPEVLQNGKCVPIVPLVSQNSKTTDTTYTPLAPLPGFAVGKDGKVLPIDTDAHCTTDKSGKTTCATCPFGDYLNVMINIFIGFAAVLAMVMIVMGGIQYMTSELIPSKEAGKERIKNAILGLLLALGAFLILNTINPDLLNACIKLETVTIEINPDEGVPVNANAPNPPTGDITAWAQQNGKVLTMTLENGSPVQLKPCDKSQLQVYPISAFGTSFELNKYLFKSISRLDTIWRTSYSSGQSAYPMVSAGGYVCKVIIGKDGKPTKNLSFHSYGLAVDFNESSNKRGTSGNIPAGFKDAWKSQGWSWGGDWTEWTDPMHFGMGEGKNKTIKGENN